MRDHLVIAGGGQAAAQAIQSARQSGFDGRISLVADEPSLPYQRPPLSKKYLAGEMERDRLLLKPESFYASREIELCLGERVAALDIGGRSLSTSKGAELDWTHLLIATGSTPRRLDLPGSDLDGIHTLRTLADVDAIRPAFSSGKRLVIVGAGYIGLEVAAVAVSAGLEVTVLESQDRVMARTVCREISDFYAARHRDAGVDLRLGTALAAFRGDGAVSAVELADGERLPAELVIIGIGIEPNTALAEAAGLTLDNGIAVDACCRTGADGVFAAGDCTSHEHPWAGQRVRLESVQNAIEQGKAAAAAIVGEDKPFDAVPWFWSDQYDLKLQIAGLSLGYDETVVRGRPDDGSFSVFYLAEGRVIAVDAINDPRGFILARQRLTDKPRWPVEAIADPDSDLAALPG